MSDAIDDIEEEEAFGITDKFVSDVMEAVEADADEVVEDLVDPLHPADVAHLIEQLDDKDRKEFLRVWPGGIEGEVISELDDNLREEVIDSLDEEELAEAVRDLDSDDVVDLIEDLDDEQTEAVLEALDDSDRALVEQALTYPEESAGRHMQVELVRGPEHWTVGDAIVFLRSDVELPEQFYHIILVDPRMTPVGYVTLGRILSSDRKTPLKDLEEDSFRTFNVEQDVEEGHVVWCNVEPTFG